MNSLGALYFVCHLNAFKDLIAQLTPTTIQHWNQKCEKRRNSIKLRHSQFCVAFSSLFSHLWYVNVSQHNLVRNVEWKKRRNEKVKHRKKLAYKNIFIFQVSPSGQSILRNVVDWLLLNELQKMRGWKVGKGL